MVVYVYFRVHTNLSQKSTVAENCRTCASRTYRVPETLRGLVSDGGPVELCFYIFSFSTHAELCALIFASVYSGVLPCDGTTPTYVPRSVNCTSRSSTVIRTKSTLTRAYSPYTITIFTYRGCNHTPKFTTKRHQTDRTGTGTGTRTDRNRDTHTDDGHEHTEQAPEQAQGHTPLTAQAPTQPSHEQCGCIHHTHRGLPIHPTLSPHHTQIHTIRRSPMYKGI